MSHPEKFLLAGVMGWPIMHSRSPLLHNYWLEKHGLIGRYVPLAIKVERLKPALRALPALGFSGCNLTIPHKIEALTIVDEVHEAARRIGAVNCIIVRPDDSLYGVNNDGWGYIENVVERVPGWRADAGPVVVLGAGGGARAVVVALLDRGAKEVRLVNRTPARATAMKQQIGGAIEVVEWPGRHKALQGAAMLVNTTSQGMVGQPALDISLDQLPKAALVSDIVYTPLETPLLAAARRRGNPTVDGLGMLLHQARPAFKAWFGVLPEVTSELRQKIEATL
ncbi:MAG: shikimate dehydrogenase [Alphaproteobacteria bacterium]|nr:shikimate dehydrogenase [Alphaproteobacteria bacterium]